jgi:uracil-DNA glycosylase
MLQQWCIAADVRETAYENVSIHTTPNNRPLTYKEIKREAFFLNLRLDLYKDAGGWRYVAIGKSAAAALTILSLDFYEMPHPSGLNRQLNDPKFVAEKINGLAFWANPLKID